MKATCIATSPEQRELQRLVPLTRRLIVGPYMLAGLLRHHHWAFQQN